MKMHSAFCCLLLAALTPCAAADLLVHGGTIHTGDAKHPQVEALLIRDGKLLEGSSSNVWLVRDGLVATPPEQGCMLTGITRFAVIDACREAGVPVVERDISADELARADELWISSSLRELRAVTCVDGRTLGDGGTGPIYRRVLAALQTIKARECPPR